MQKSALLAALKSVIQCNPSGVWFSRCSKRAAGCTLSCILAAEGARYLIAVAPGFRILPHFAESCRPNPLIFFRCNIGRRTLNQRVAGSSPARLTNCSQRRSRVWFFAHEKLPNFVPQPFSKSAPLRSSTARRFASMRMCEQRFIMAQAPDGEIWYDTRIPSCYYGGQK